MRALLVEMHDALVDCVESLKRLPDADGAFRVTCIQEAEKAIKAVREQHLPDKARPDMHRYILQYTVQVLVEDRVAPCDRECNEMGQFLFFTINNRLDTKPFIFSEECSPIPLRATVTQAKTPVIRFSP